MKTKRLFELILLGAMWGPSYLFIKLAVEDVSPFALAAGRIALAAAALYLILRLRGTRLPREKRIWWHCAYTGLFANSLPFILFAFGEMRVSSAMAGIINGSTPIVTALLAHYFIPAERLTFSRAGGVLLGLSGFCVLLVPSLLTSGFQGDFWGVVCIGIASIAYAVGMVHGRRFLTGQPPLAVPTCQLIISSCYMIPLAIISHPFMPSQFSWTAIGSVAVLGFWGTAAAFWLYYRVLEHSGAGYLAMSNYLLPLFGIVLGALFLNEGLGYSAYIAGVLILMGMMLVGGTIKLPQTQQTDTEI